MSKEVEEAKTEVVVGCLVLTAMGVGGLLSCGFTALVALALIKYVWGF